MRNKILFVFIALINFGLYSQNFQWAKSFGSTSDDINRAVTVDASGFVYTTGSFQGTVDFDPSASVYTLTATSSQDIFVTKFDASGNFVWAKSMNGSGGGSTGISIAVDASGNVYTTGWFNNSTVDFNPGAPVYTLTSNGLEDIYISKLDASGNFVWAKSFGSTGADYVEDIKLDGSNNVIVTGQFRNTCDFDPGAATYTLTSLGVQDMFINKLDVAGNFIWADRIGDVSNDQSKSIFIDTSDNIFITGSFGGIVDFDPGAGTYTLSSGPAGGAVDHFICKLNSSGALLWAKNLGANIAQGLSIVLDNSGNIFTAGKFQGTVDFDPGAGVSNMASIAGQWDVFVQKLDPSGNFLWAKQINYTSTNIDDIDVDNNGNIYLGGTFSNTVDVDPNATVNSLSATGGSNICIVVWSSSGNFVWARNCGGTAVGSYAYSLDVDQFKNIHLCGFFYNTVDFDPNAPIYNLTSNGSTDAYILKLSVACTVTSTLVSQSNVSCFGLSNGSATVSVSGGSTPYTYSWSPSGGSSNIATGLIANTYTCLITDNSSCTTSKTVTITQPAVLTSSISSQTNVQCNGTNTGSLALSISGGTGSYTYSWSPTGGSSSNLVNQAAGNYTCVIKDANLCSVTQTAAITQPSVIASSITSQTNVSCNGGSNGSVLINANGGTGTLTYSWQPIGGTSSTANSLSAGNYTCTIADANNCSKQQTVSITQPTPLLAAITASNNITCFGNQNGSATINASGGSGNYTYSWTPSSVGTSSTATNLSAGTYTCLVSDMNSCNTSTMLTITAPSAISSTATVTNPSCSDSNDGIADLSISGGSSPYSVVWSNGSAALQNSNLSGGTYTANITDANSCTYTVSVLVQASSNPCFFVPNGFSPNGDGINDTWVIAGINNYPNVEVTVLNRWGQAVLKTTNYSTPWDGNYNGNILPTSDYYYIINLNDGSKALTGTLTIKR